MSDSFYPELAAEDNLPRIPLIRGVLFELEGTLAHRTRPIEELMEEGARNAEAYMRSEGMELPDDFWNNIVEARIFAFTKSEEEQEEHIGDDAMSFLLQFFGYPASQMDLDVLHRSVDIFYAPEMTAWELYPYAFETLLALRGQGYRLGIVANYSCDRVFQRTVDYLGLREHLDLCLTSASVEYRKPDTAIFDIVLEQWDLLPYELVITGPSGKHDISAAIELGAQAVLTRLDPDASVAAELPDSPAPDATISTLSQLPPIIQKWASA
jgi:FMN phosphatase YigB (HAD superfamily)